MGRSRKKRSSQRVNRNKRSSSPAEAPVAERPPTSRLVLSAVLVLIPALMFSYLLMTPPMLNNPVVKEVDQTGWKIVRQAEATGSWPETLDGLWGPGEAPPAGAAISWDPKARTLSAVLDEPLRTRSFLNILSFGALGTVQETYEFTLRLEPRATMPGNSVPE